MNEFGTDIKGAFSRSAEYLIVSVRNRYEERRVRLGGDLIWTKQV